MVVVDHPAAIPRQNLHDDGCERCPRDPKPPSQNSPWDPFSVGGNLPNLCLEAVILANEVIQKTSRDQHLSPCAECTSSHLQWLLAKEAILHNSSACDENA